MPLFRYTIIDQNGNRQTKTMNASSKLEVVQTLQKNNYFVVQVVEAGTKVKSLIKHLKANDKIDFTRNISVLLSSGVSLGESLAIIADDTPNKQVSAFYYAIQSELERGNPLSRALGAYPLFFDSVYVSLVKAGEDSGQLDTVMSSLADSLEKDIRLRSQVKSALMYPGFVLATLAGLGGAITFFVLPKITKVFEELKVNLPLTTRMLIAFSKVIEKYPLIVLSGILLIAASLILYLRSRSGKKATSLLALKVPFVKPIISNLDLFRLSSTLALLLNAGITIQEALSISGGTVQNPKLKAEFTTAAGKLATGIGLAPALQQTSLPKTFITLVAVGERSGKIATIFQTLAGHYSQQLDAAIKNFTSILEPVLTLIVGLMVGGVVITIMVPIYQFVGNLTG